MKKFFLLLITLFVLIAAVWAFSNKIMNNGDRPQEKALTENKLNKQTLSPQELQEQFLNIGDEDFFAEIHALPVCNGNDNDPNNNHDHEIHEYKGFTLCYRESYEDAEWVAYILTREELNAVTGRTNNFRPDPSISTGSSDPSDYKKSGYDRGHLAPAADMEWSKESCSESFFMSNMTPQNPAFNRGMWQQLESAVRGWADRFGKVMVVTGPILEKNPTDYNNIGDNKVSVPEYFYKSILACNTDGTTMLISFIMPNEKRTGTIWDYCVTTDEIENRCNFDLFSFLPDDTEDLIESSLKTDSWK